MFVLKPKKLFPNIYIYISEAQERLFYLKFKKNIADIKARVRQDQP